jgi:LmbE family N-acetylglucosaminyl deacetylase
MPGCRIWEARIVTSTMLLDRWIFLSPHLDDAILSCGGLIARLTRNRRVEIWTLFCGAPRFGPFSDLASWMHQVSGGQTGSRLARIRRREDNAAAQFLGAKCVHFHYHDAVYRRSASKKFLYSDNRQNSWSPHDDWLVADISGRLSQCLHDGDRLLFPLAVGKHVDHMITRAAAETLSFRNSASYPDVPYAQRFPIELVAATAGSRIIEYTVDDSCITKWVQAVALYSSQIRMLEEAVGSLSDLIHSYATQSKGLQLFSTNNEVAESIHAELLKCR